MVWGEQALTSMFPFAFSRLSITPSTTWFIFLTPASSLRSAASLASSVSYLDWPGVALGREEDGGGSSVSESDVLDLWAFFWSRREGEAKRSSVSESDRCKSFI